MIAVYPCKYIIVEHKLIDSGYIFIAAIDQSKNYIKQITTSCIIDQLKFRLLYIKKSEF